MALQWSSPASLTITAGSLGSGSNRSSAAVTTSTTTNVTKTEVTVSVLTTATAPSGNKQVVVYAYKGDGTDYTGNSGTTDNVDGTDKALTAIGSPTSLVYLGSIPLNQGAVAVTAVGVFDLASVDPKWGIVLYNDAGTALGATVTATYRELYYN